VRNLASLGVCLANVLLQAQLQISDLHRRLHDAKAAGERIVQIETQRGRGAEHPHEQRKERAQLD
jgi:hypothetical protein